MIEKKKEHLKILTGFIIAKKEEERESSAVCGTAEADEAEEVLCQSLLYYFLHSALGGYWGWQPGSMLGN